MEVELAGLVRQAEEHLRQENWRPAVPLLERAAALEPSDAAIWYKLGVACLQLGLHERAEGCFRKAVALDSRHAKARTNLGVILQQAGKEDEAARFYREALEADEGVAQAWFNLGILLLEGKQAIAAVEHLRRALALDATPAAWHSMLGLALQAGDRPLEAADSFRAALRIDPRLAAAHLELGTCLMKAGEVDAALDAFRQALELDPALQQAWSHSLFALNFSPKETPERIFAEHVAWGRRLGTIARAGNHGNEPGPERRLRLAYMSPDLADPSVACLLEPVIAAHDASAFEVVCYSDAEADSQTTWRLRRLCAVWHATAQLSNEQLAARILEDRIDLLVDLAGHSAGGKRMPLFAQQPAPIQISWLRYPCTTGLEAFDYRITDRQISPDGAERLYTERLVRAPECQWCFAPQLDAAVAEASPAERQGFVTFGSLHALPKLSPPVIATWSKVLHRVPGSRLLIAARAGRSLAGRLAGRFREEGVDPDRLEILDAPASYPSLHARIDISLDTWPYAGVAATFNSLWMGVPVVTLRGESPASRSGASILGALGLDALVAGDESEYAEIAVALAGDARRRSALRRELRARLERSPLMDSKRFARELEKSYRGMWRTWCARAPAPATASQALPGPSRPAPLVTDARGGAQPRVIVDGVFFQDHAGGITRVWRSLLREWVASGFADRVLLLDRDGTAPKIPGLRSRAIPRHSYDRLPDDRALLQRICDEEGAAAFMSTYYSMPTRTPAVMLVHDMIPEVFGMDRGLPSWQEKHACVLYARRFVAVSRNTARDLGRHYPLIRPEEVTVAHNGVDPLFSPAESPEIERFRRLHGIAKPYFLLVGSRAGYKNTRAFFRAFTRLADRSRYAVLCVGGEPLEAHELAACAGSDLHQLRLDDEALRLAYCAAIALVYPSRYEGFGMPVAEAMRCGCPVITTSLSSLPEVAGDSALFVDPMDVDGLAIALERVQDRALRSELIARGIEHAKAFSWTAMARSVAAILSELAAGRSA